MLNLKIKNSAFSAKSDSEMDTFAAGVVAKVKANQERYVEVDKFYQDLLEAQLAYNKAFSDFIAVNSDQNRSAKNQAKTTIVTQLTSFGNALVTYANGVESYITDLGYVLQSRRVIPINPNPSYPPPTVLEIRSTGISGQIYFRLSVQSASKVKLIELEYSTDMGIKWLPKEDFTTLINTMSGFPSKSDISIRFRTVHARGIKSPYSEIVTITTN